MQVKQEKPELPSVWTRMCSKNSEWPDKVIDNIAHIKWP